MDKRILLATLMFGSIWGLSECTLGAVLHLAYLPAGEVMTVIAIGLMTMSRAMYNQPGMQIRMGVIAASFKLLNLGYIGGCVWCAVVAIISEAVIFEYMIDKKFLMKIRNTSRLLSGAVIGYSCYTGGYLLAEAVTPLFFSAGLFLSDLVALVPMILWKGILPAIITALMFHFAFFFESIKKAVLENRMYYPATALITVLCWLAAMAV